MLYDGEWLTLLTFKVTLHIKGRDRTILQIFYNQVHKILYCDPLKLTLGMHLILKKSLALVFLAVIILEYCLFFSTVQAQVPAQDQITNSSPGFRPYIRLYDEYGNLRTEFVQREQMRIVTYFPSPIYLLKVVDPDGKTLFWTVVVSSDCRHYGVFDSGLISGLTDKPGKCYVETGILFWFKVRTFFVTPVAPLGVVGILAACFTGLGLKYAKARKGSS